MFLLVTNARAAGAAEREHALEKVDHMLRAVPDDAPIHLGQIRL